MSSACRSSLTERHLLCLRLGSKKRKKKRKHIGTARQLPIKIPSLCNRISPLAVDSIFIAILAHVCARAPVHVFHTDVDECQSLSTCANGICLNSEGSYTCENCPTGYRVSYDGELCEG